MRIKYSKVEIKEIEEFDSRIDVFWNEIRNHYNLITEKNREYLNWRYCDSRGGKYQIRIAEEDGRIQGYIILRIDRGKNMRKTDSIGYIVDLLSFPNRLDIINILLIDGLRFFEEASVRLVQSLVVKNNPYEKMLRKHNFLNTKAKVIMFYKFLNTQSLIDESILPEEVHIQYGDTDWI
jgi:hypothetical protein